LKTEKKTSLVPLTKEEIRELEKIRGEKGFSDWNKKSFPIKFRNVRNRLGLKQAEMGRLFGISIPTVTHWESINKKNPITNGLFLDIIDGIQNNTHKIEEMEKKTGDRIETFIKESLRKNGQAVTLYRLLGILFENK